MRRTMDMVGNHFYMAKWTLMYCSKTVLPHDAHFPCIYTALETVSPHVEQFPQHYANIETESPHVVQFPWHSSRNCILKLHSSWDCIIPMLYSFLNTALLYRLYHPIILQFPQHYATLETVSPHVLQFPHHYTTIETVSPPCFTVSWTLHCSRDCITPY